ncbi:MAG TPA: tRNA (guanosine(46)-N7)-methyltransferase TrmB [Chthoniobacterales bacterium]|nr:tRNA (guanosine(46)-N7)-methyltransferase TrmB [Chthoniobacterales bacterium]
MIELIPETYVAPLDLLAIFGRVAPLQVDLGCGDGSFLCELAQLHPDKDFLGIDRLVGRVAKACRKAAAVENVRILNVESSYAVGYLLPEGSVETFYLLFPDPWPKRRHHRRRIVTPDFLDSIHRALEDGGSLRVATDQLDYFEQICGIARDHSRFAMVDVEDADLPLSKFERRFNAAGAPIYRLALQKISPVR